MKQETMTKLNEQVEQKIEQILNEKINASNLEDLYKVIDIYKDIKEVECMNYSGNYGNYGNYGNSYGRPGYDSYGRRGVDMKYRGGEYLDRMAGEYGRYSESYGRYGASQETDKSFHYMVEALKDFIKVLYEEANTPQQKQMLQEAIQKSMMM
jgi:Zn-dependent M32 family carboxypeptidase